MNFLLVKLLKDLLENTVNIGLSLDDVEALIPFHPWQKIVPDFVAANGIRVPHNNQEELCSGQGDIDSALIS